MSKHTPVGLAVWLGGAIAVAVWLGAAIGVATMLVHNAMVQ